MVTSLLGVATLVVVASCGGSSTATTTTAPTVATVPQATTTAAPGDTAPGVTAQPATSAVPVPPVLEVTANLVGGGTIDLAAYAGRPLAVWFWAPT